MSKVTREPPAAYKHPEVAGAAGEDGDAVNATAVISSLPAVAAEALYAVAEAVQGGPEPVKSQGRFHVSVLLKRFPKMCINMCTNSIKWLNFKTLISIFNQSIYIYFR